MTNELLQSLKDAEFPKKGFEYDKGFPKVKINSKLTLASDEARWLSEPTLEELMDACGEKVGLLGYAPDDWVAVYPVRDNAYYDASYREEGKTKKEAVAKLWLTLNKK